MLGVLPAVGEAAVRGHVVAIQRVGPARPPLDLRACTAMAALSHVPLLCDWGSTEMQTGCNSTRADYRRQWSGILKRRARGLTTHVLDGRRAGESPQVRVADPRELRLDRLQHIAGDLQASVGGILALTEPVSVRSASGLLLCENLSKIMSKIAKSAMILWPDSKDRGTAARPAYGTA